MVEPLSITEERASLILNERYGVLNRVASSHVEVDVICRPLIEPVHGPAAIPKSGLKPINILPFLDIARYNFKLKVYCDCTAISVDNGVIVTLPELIGMAIAWRVALILTYAPDVLFNHKANYHGLCEFGAFIVNFN